jgi:hypothetical protein
MVFSKRRYCSWSRPLAPTFGLDTLLPTSQQIQALLRRKTQLTLVPLAVLEHAQLFEQLAYQSHVRVGNGNIVRGPRIRGDFVFAPA